MRALAFALFPGAAVAAYFYALGQAIRIEWWTPAVVLLLVAPAWAIPLMAGVFNLYDNRLGFPLLRWSFWRGTWVEPPRRPRCPACGGSGRV